MVYMTTTQRYEIEAWLGDDHNLTDDQVTHLMLISDEIDAHYCTPDPDVDDPEQVRDDLRQDTEHERQAAITTAYRLMTEVYTTTVVVGLARDLYAARQAQAAALASLRQAARMVIRPGGRGIESQAGFADSAGVTRMAVRDWLGL